MRQALLALACLATPAAAQAPRGVEAGLSAVTTLGRTDFVGGGPALAWRAPGGVRLAVQLLAGDRAGRTAGRGEFALHLLLTPARRHGLGVYGTGGVAMVADRRWRGDLLLGAGVETSPGGRWGVQLEGGIGGGARVLLGVRRRWLHRGRGS